MTGTARRRLGRLLLRVALRAAAVVTILVATTFAWYLATRYPAAAAQKGYLALTRATVLVGDDLQPQRGATVLIRDGRIVQVGDADDVTVPLQAATLDLSGYTLLPGLMDLHVHLGSPDGGSGQPPGLLQTAGLILDAVRFAPGTRRNLLSHGVTTVRCVGNDHQWVMELRPLLRSGELEGPRLFAAGPLFSTPGGHPVATIFAGRKEEIGGLVRLPGHADEARQAVRELAAGDNRVDLIKVVQERGGPAKSLEPIRPEVLHAIVDEAHRHGLPVFAHWGTREDLEEVLAAGVDGLEHIGRVLDGWPDGIVGALVERRISITPTLAVMEVKLPSPVMLKVGRLVAAFHAAGGRVVVGSDAGMPGVPFGAGVHRELELLVRSGLTPQEALKAATSVAAQVLRTNDIGAIAPGRAADLVVVDGDPLQDIRATRNVVLVFRDGRPVVDRRGQGQRP